MCKLCAGVDVEKVVELIRTFSGPFDAMVLSWAYDSFYGQRIDWHEFVDVLEALLKTGTVKVSKPGGMIQYRVSNPAEPEV